jgi:1-deoxy-D-xylulose-5-phosphate reductoisomerase
MKRLTILGSTGSIGRQALEIVDAFPGEFEIIGLGARRDADALAQQARRYRPRAVALVDEGAAARIRDTLPPGIEIFTGTDALRSAARLDGDIVLVAVVGIAGLLPTLEALRSGHDVALANKETLVAGGALVMDAVRASGRRLVPVDSEHAAVQQCLLGEDPQTVTRILLTGSGGPFLRRPIDELTAATPAEALAHPTWKMGARITVDSATLMNKGFEVVEAHWLFGLAPEQIEVVIHPQSIVHSLVEFADGSVKAHLAPPDMRLVIAYALRGPARSALPLPGLDWTRLDLTFERPDPGRYPCLALAYEALRAGRTMPAVLNAADELAVERFLAGAIPFTDIARWVERAMDAHRPSAIHSVDDILAADAWARAQASAEMR